MRTMRRFLFHAPLLPVRTFLVAQRLKFLGMATRSCPTPIADALVYTACLALLGELFSSYLFPGKIDFRGESFVCELHLRVKATHMSTWHSVP
jgi:hypothetical protein